MKYKNEITCPSCGSLNFDYDYKCFSCKSFLREKIVNIDLGETLLRLIDSPSEIFHKIKLAEHKNYLLLILIFLSFRFLILSRFISVPLTQKSVETDIFILVIVSLINTFSLFVLLAFISQKALDLNKVKGRFKDILSVLTYSFVPNVFALLILFPIELVFYGEYLFSNNPYPYQIKESVFYLLFGLEILMMIWSVFLLMTGLNEFLKSRFLSILYSIIIWFTILTALYLQSDILFIQQKVVIK